LRDRCFQDKVKNIQPIYIIRLFIKSLKYNFKLGFFGGRYKTINLYLGPIIKFGGMKFFSMRLLNIARSGCPELRLTDRKVTDAVRLVDIDQPPDRSEGKYERQIDE
jgi:hypothetical protein